MLSFSLKNSSILYFICLSSYSNTIQRPIMEFFFAFEKFFYDKLTWCLAHKKVVKQQEAICLLFF